VASASLRERVRAHWRALLLGAAIGIAGCAIFGATVLPTLLLTHRAEWPGEHLIAGFALGMAANLNAPPKITAPTDSRTIQRGMYAYTGSCAQCHGTKGDGKDGILSNTLFPPATDFRSEDAMEKSDADLFWATKNGLAFTAMPAFGNQFNDETITAIVAYLRQLQRAGTGAAAPQSLVVPTPGTTQLIKADPAGDAIARGGAIYFAQNCQACHGGEGDGPGELRLRSISADTAAVACQIRNGPNGMPAYDTTMISDQQMSDLIAFMRSFLPAEQPRQGGFRPEGQRPPGAPAPSGAAPIRPEGFAPPRGNTFSSLASTAPDFPGCPRG
jgi:mono/diheme cytochrome c family protein